MAGNDLCALCLASEDLDHLACNKAVRRSVCAVTANTVVGVEVVGKRIHICFGSHALVESCIKYENLRLVAHYSETALNALDVSLCVERREVNATSECFKNLVCEKN